MRLQGHLENLNESNANQIADDMARLVMGDSSQALNNLKKQVPFDAKWTMDTFKYNKAYAQLYKDIKKAIDKAIKSGTGD